MLRIAVSTVALLTVFASLSVYAANDDRLIRQRNTIDELAARVAELKTENDRLSLALKNAMQASRDGREVKEGCNVTQLEELTAFESNGVSAERASLKWLKTEGKKCSSSQLVQVESVVKGLQFTSNSLRALKLLMNRL